MTKWRVLKARFGEWLRRRRVDEDTDAELRAHIDHLTDDLVGRGLDPAAARRRALLEFGGLEPAREAVRDRRGFRPVETVLRDVRYAVRLLVKAPGFTSATVLTLALGIGANAAIFSLVDGVMLRPLPYRDPAALVALREIAAPPASEPGAGPRRIAVAPANLADYRTSRLAVGFAAYMTTVRSFSGAGSPERLAGEEVTPEYFSVLGVAPLHGRLLDAGDAGAAGVVVVSHAFWRERLGAGPDAIGRTIRLDDAPFEIVGVMPAAFQGVSHASGSVPVAFWTPVVLPPEMLANRGEHVLSVIARLAPHASSDQLAGQLRAIAAGFSPAATPALSVEATDLRADIARDVKPLFVLLVAAVGVVLLLACVNVASLLIVRSIGRRREIAVRLALGATRWRVAGELLTQSLVLTAAGAAAGFGLSLLLKDALLAVTPATIPRLDSVAVDGRVLLFTMAITAVPALVFGLLPALQFGRTGPGEALATTERVVSGTWASGVRTGLMILEVAFSTLLLVGAALMVRSLLALNAVPLGFDTTGVLTANVRLPDSRYRTPTARLQFFDRVVDQIARLPGVEAVAFGNRLPLRGGWTSGLILEAADGRAASPPDTSSGFQSVSPAYFDVFRIPLIRGRLIADADREGAPAAAVVNEEFARRFFGGANPIGRRLRRFADAPSIEIVGVVGDIRRGGRTTPIAPEVYLPAAQTSLYPLRLEQIAVRVSGNPLARADDVRAAIWAVDADQPVAAVRTLEELLALQQGERRFQTFLFGTFAAFALALAVIGIYSVVTYAISQRTAEIALRLALGASVAGLHRWILLHWLGLVGVGAAVGLVGALMLGGLIGNLLFGVSPADPTALVGAAAVITIAAIAASLIAARTATRIEAAAILK